MLIKAPSLEVCETCANIVQVMRGAYIRLASVAHHVYMCCICSAQFLVWHRICACAGIYVSELLHRLSHFLTCGDFVCLGRHIKFLACTWKDICSLSLYSFCFCVYILKNKWTPCLNRQAENEKIKIHTCLRLRRQADKNKVRNAIRKTQ